MTVVFTAAANADLDNILAYTKRHFPNQLDPLLSRLREVIERIEHWPRSASIVAQRPGVRVVPPLKYPFRIFYREIVGASRYCISTTSRSLARNNKKGPDIVRPFSFALRRFYFRASTSIRTDWRSSGLHCSATSRKLRSPPGRSKE